ncbi:response regulator transcription factor [Dehalococcoides mccartyi]|jgi:DNA-binding response OmpR family regulator|uniref:response regulator transcription factor n=1 Tax=Dehalococcoides mccartyi TaxID=61435 RepID=UPI0003C84F88|nr:response regulator transcription factor [Dehalococcoides mccartyi]AHB12876.1 DNA-binding response regulator, two-component system, OmpR family [Dehalococcoides mccartyi GY50]AII57304.1 transcriptional regulator [Dehalococcoides mccartyi CG1]
MKLLLIEDDAEIVDVVCTIFQIGCPNSRVISASNGRKGIEIVESANPDIILLDLGLPDMNGFDVLKQIRNFSDIPIIILTVRGDESDVVRGLTLGANDYIIKPFRQMELLARVRRLLTKKQINGEDLSITCGKMRFGSSIRELWINDTLINLTVSEGRIIYMLMKNHDKTVSYEDLSELLWGDYYPEARSNLKTHILRLRNKIEDTASEPKLLINSPNHGYILRTID